MIDILKKSSLLFLLVFGSLVVSAKNVEAYYEVRADVLIGRKAPSTNAAKVTEYQKRSYIFITELSRDENWGYVFKDKAWVNMSYVKPLSKAEVSRHIGYQKFWSITPDSELWESVRPKPNGSKPLRILLWIFVGLVVIGAAVMFFTGYSHDALKAYFATIALCSVSLVVVPYAQYIVSWVIKFLSWVDYYILFGWALNDLGGILAIISIIQDLPTYGFFGLVAGIAPGLPFFLITEKYKNFKFVRWITYVFQIAMFLAVMVIVNEQWYAFFNSIMTLDGVPSIRSLAKACDWGAYASSVFVWVFYISLAIMLFTPYFEWKYNNEVWIAKIFGIIDKITDWTDKIAESIFNK